MPRRDLPAEIFSEEFIGFVKMGLSKQEIARAFGYSMDTLEHRIRRAGITYEGR